jgi:hypothetical protein
VTALAENIREIRERIERAAISCGRASNEILLLAISKTFSVESILEALGSGQRHFGENKVQEAEPKVRYFQDRKDLEWHLVGHLQSNKARRACELFQVIHSVDSIRLAERLSLSAAELGKTLSVLVQVNLGQEETKSGVPHEQVYDLVERIVRLPGLQVDGLMIIPPFFADPNQARPFFSELRELRDRLESEEPGCMGRRHLSMGMSHDFEVAIAEGATIVRIGTAIFGPRK